MSGRCVAIALAVLVLPAAGTDTVFGQGCLHGSDEQPSQRMRRTEALQVGQQIHLAQGAAKPMLPLPQRGSTSVCSPME